ncbi:hypothetical protein VaNZ11_007024 [Volvox africanus]|uniref:3'-5' exonuclease domain-containing protein n=1 Tax=Volvox africanus TaxID=51714 RepID=A0ABQ5S1Z3_9CHLO|nr:hypothetical protein VaNZ11_007024 [Volvox africanus]
MALIWRHRINITTSSIIQNLYLLLFDWSSTAFSAALALDKALQPCSTIFPDTCYWHSLTTISAPGVAFEPQLLFMTASFPKVCRGGSVRHSGDISTEKSTDFTHASGQCANDFGATSGRELRTGANPADTGPRGCSDCGRGVLDGVWSFTAETMRRASTDAELFGSTALAVGQAVPSGICAGANAWARRHDDSPSDESSFRTKRKLFGQSERETRSDHQGHSRGTAKQQLALSGISAHLSFAKSAKRQAAEALLTARFGRVGSVEAKPGGRYLCSSSAALYNCRITDSAFNSPDLPSASADTFAAARNAIPIPLSHQVDIPSDILGGMSVLRQQADSQAHAGEGKPTQTANAAAKAAAVGPASSPPGPVHATVASFAVARQLVHLPGPPTKRARLSLSAAVTSSLAAGLFAPAVTAVAQPLTRAATTQVPPCDPARGCKAKLQVAAAAASSSMKGFRLGTSSAMYTDSSAADASGQAADYKSASLEPVWCSFEVTLQPINWQPVFDEPAGSLQRFSLARGYEKMLLPQGLVTYVVENEQHIGDALRNLKAGMQDRVVAIDLEWRPETVSGRVSPVALLQVSSGSVCLVVRTSCMGYLLPSELRSFLEDPGHVVLGFGWDSADESKMRGTFGLGRADFRRFLDLQEVAASLGYHGFGLSRLSQKVLGIVLPKSKSISRSNWAAPQLSNHQLKYASLDVLVAGQLFRALRLWHSSPSPCPNCRSPIGELLLPGPLHCDHPSCGRSSANLQQHRDHCVATGHSPRFAACSTCGRLYELPSTAKEQANRKDGEEFHRRRSQDAANGTD